MTQETTLRILTVDGEVHEFAMPVQADNGAAYTIGSRIEKLLNQRSIALAVDDRLLIIPMEQIRSIEMYPIVNKLPENVVPAVRAIRSSIAESKTCTIPKSARRNATVHAAAELVPAGR